MSASTRPEQPVISRACDAVILRPAARSRDAYAPGASTSTRQYRTSYENAWRTGAIRVCFTVPSKKVQPVVSCWRRYERGKSNRKPLNIAYTVCLNMQSRSDASIACGGADALCRGSPDWPPEPMFAALYLREARERAHSHTFPHEKCGVEVEAQTLKVRSKD